MHDHIAIHKGILINICTHTHIGHTSSLVVVNTLKIAHTYTHTQKDTHTHTDTKFW